MTVMTVATKVEKLETAIAEGFRPLQTTLRDMRDAKLITLEISNLRTSFDVLKAEAQRLIDGYRPIAEIQDATATNEQKIEKVLASLPAGTITNNSDFSARILDGTDDEKLWLVKKDGDGAALTFVKSEGARYYDCFAGDALRAIALIGMTAFIERNVLRTRVATPYAVRLVNEAKHVGLTLNLHDRIPKTQPNGYLAIGDFYPVYREPLEQAFKTAEIPYQIELYNSIPENKNSEGVLNGVYDGVFRVYVSAENYDRARQLCIETERATTDQKAQQLAEYLATVDPMGVYRMMTQENAVRLAPGTYDKWRDVQEKLGNPSLPPLARSRASSSRSESYG